MTRQEICSLNIAELARAYRKNTLNAQEVAEAYLESINENNEAIYLKVTSERALSQARHADDLFSQGIDLGPLQGIPLALKDVIGTKGDVTTAGSKALAQSNLPAGKDALVAKRLSEAGAVFLGKTNMTELAFSGVGINPHYGTPESTLAKGCIPGGSSSGSAVAVAKNLACAALGSDTGGSVRIPSTFNGLVGLKTTDGDIPTEGIQPLSFTLDTIGPITHTVEDAFILWQGLAARGFKSFRSKGVKGLHLLKATTVVQEGLDKEVADAFDHTCKELSNLGAEVIEKEVPEFAKVQQISSQYGYLAGFESFALYEDLLAKYPNDIDPKVVARVTMNKDKRAVDYVRILLERKQLRKSFWQAYEKFDAILAPTVPILPPRISFLDEESEYFRANSLCLQNTLLFNFLGVPAVSVPCVRGKPIGFMIATKENQEHLSLSIAHAVEKLE